MGRSDLVGVDRMELLLFCDPDLCPRRAFDSGDHIGPWCHHSSQATHAEYAETLAAKSWLSKAEVLRLRRVRREERQGPLPLGALHQC